MHLQQSWILSCSLHQNILSSPLTKDGVFQHVFCKGGGGLVPTPELGGVIPSEVYILWTSSTCIIERNLQKSNVDDWQWKEKVLKVQELNVFLKEQRIKIGKS
ncbi:hypothetical protein Fot_29217 [Forsythia ovata]|uniref:Uncharacterized protein n=1 Tax=Forsythia ovata TaxID=205694 RepID=A0ABD1TRA4_9LAMI